MRKKEDKCCVLCSPFHWIGKWKMCRIILWNWMASKKGKFSLKQRIVDKLNSKVIVYKCAKAELFNEKLLANIKLFPFSLSYQTFFVRILCVVNAFIIYYIIIEFISYLEFRLREYF